METNNEERKVNTNYRFDPADTEKIPFSHPTQFIGRGHTNFVQQGQAAKQKSENYRKFYARVADASEYIDRGETGPIYVILKDALTYSDPTMPLASEIAVMVENLERCLSTDEITAARLLLAMK